jgi:surface polysaccharide O-acyltransferase-like enzyme
MDRNRYLLEIIIIIIVLVIAIFVRNIQKNNCIEKGGSVITNSIGIYEKCIYEGK